MPQDNSAIDLTAAFTDHDRLFKELLTVFFVDFVDLFLPDVAEYIDRDSVSFLGSEIFSNVATNEKHVVDVLARARFRDEEAFFLVHVENQSKKQPDFAERMFYYFADISKTHRLPVYPVALLTYDRPLRQGPDQHRVAFPGFEPLNFRYRAIQLNRLNWRDFLGHSNPVAAALMAKMKIAPVDRPRVKSECLRLLATMQLDPARAQIISGFVDTYLKLTKAEMRLFEREIDSFPQEVKDVIMPLTISWKEEGRAEGLEKGRAEGLSIGRVEGRVEGERALLIRVGERRLGTPKSETITALEAITSSERLIELGGRLLDVETWDELLSAEV